MHIGSQITDMAAFAANMDRIAQLMRGIAERRPQIGYVDAGGGLGIDYEELAMVRPFRRR